MTMRANDPPAAPEPRWHDGELVLWVTCPDCRMRGLVDDDQAHGRVSTDCPNCPYHETVNWWLQFKPGLEDALRTMGPPADPREEER